MPDTTWTAASVAGLTAGGGPDIGPVALVDEARAPLLTEDGDELLVDGEGITFETITTSGLEVT